MNTIITGASKGIGRALVEKFASEGHNLAICARNEENLKSLKKELETKYSGIQVLIKSTDISKRKDVLAFAEAALKMFGSIDVLTIMVEYFYLDLHMKKMKVHLRS